MRTKKKKHSNLKRILEIYHIQFKAAMRAQSLGLCKKCIKHALDDEERLMKGVEDVSIK